MSAVSKLKDVTLLITKDEYEAIVHLGCTQGWGFDRTVSAIIRGWALEYRLTLQGQQ